MRALVLSGGGSKGSYQVGALSQLAINEGLAHDILCGVSVGALNAAAISQFSCSDGVEAAQWLENFWQNKILGTESIYKRWFPFGRFHSLWKKSVYDSSPVAKLVRTNLSAKKIMSSGRKLAVGAVCLDDGEHRFAYQNNPDIIEWVLASASYPIFFEPITIEQKMWSDGGLINVTPLREAVRFGADEIDVVMCSNPWLIDNWKGESKVAVPSQIIRSADLMSSQIMKSDIEIVGLKNDIADISAKFKHIKIRLIAPSQFIDHNSLDFSPKKMRSLIEFGKEDVLNERYISN